MVANARVIVPTKNYNHHDPNAQENIGSAYTLTMNDGTKVILGAGALRQIIDAYEAGRITFNEDGSIKTMDLSDR